VISRRPRGRGALLSFVHSQNGARGHSPFGAACVCYYTILIRVVVFTFQLLWVLQCVQTTRTYAQYSLVCTLYSEHANISASVCSVYLLSTETPSPLESGWRLADLSFGIPLDAGSHHGLNCSGSVHRAPSNFNSFTSTAYGPPQHN
jgi:hypothetical protein